MQSESIKKTLASVIFVAMIIVGSVSYSKYTTSQRALIRTLSTMRTSMGETVQALRRASGGDNATILFPDCRERSAYDTFLEKDTRTLSLGDLTDALRLQELCGPHFAQLKQYSLGNLKKEIAHFSDVASLIGTAKKRDQAKRIVDAWNKIALIEEKIVSLFEQQIALQEDYWTIERETKRGALSSLQREKMFGEKNESARTIQATITNLIGEATATETVENLLWREFSGS
jgi:hypothetical protein